MTHTPESIHYHQTQEIMDRLAVIEKQLARLTPLIEVAEKYLALTPMERVRASLRKP